MSTRCMVNIMIEDRIAVKIYRHCDGYPSGMGVDLSDAIGRREECDPSQLVSRILSSHAFSANIVSADSRFGDLDYEYTVKYEFEHSKGPKEIVVHELTWGPGKVVFDGTPADFRQWVLDVLYTEHYKIVKREIKDGKKSEPMEGEDM